MANPFMGAIAKRAAAPSSNPFLRGSARAGVALPDLQQQAAQLEQVNAAAGAPGIEEDKPGIFRTLIDVLSRPNYAIAGAADELLQGQSVSSAFARAGREFFSGLAGLEGDKEAWGEVLEQAGVGTKTLADALPMLEGTWPGHLGSRGAAGLFLDIATDPLTYLTFGTGAAVKLVGKGGKVFALNRQGMKRLGKLHQEMGIDDLLKKTKTGDPFAGPAKEIENFYRSADDEFLKRFAGDSQYFDPGGIKWSGLSVVSGDALSDATRFVGEPMVRALRATSAGDSVVNTVAEFGRGFRKNVNRIFHPQGDLGNLPKEMRAKAIRDHQNFMRAHAAINGRLHNVMRAGLIENGEAVIADNMEKRWRSLMKADKDIGKKFYDVREGTTFYNGERLTEAALSAEEAVVYKSLVNLHDRMGKMLVDTGVLTPEQFKANYFMHGYSPESMENLRKYHAAAFGGTEDTASLSAVFTKHRLFDDFGKADEFSKSQHKLTKALHEADNKVPIFPVLEPDFDLLKNTSKYIDMYSETLARKAWREQVFADFGVAVDKADLNALYDLEKPFLSVVPRKELLKEIDELDNIIRRSEGHPGTTMSLGHKTRVWRSRPGKTSPVDVDTLTKADRPAPLSQVEPTSGFVHENLSRRQRMDDLQRYIDDPNTGLTPEDLKEIAALPADEAAEFARARASAVKRAKAELRDLSEEQRAAYLAAGRPLAKTELAGAKARLAELRRRLHTPEVSDAHKIDTFFQGTKSLRDVERQFATFVTEQADSRSVKTIDELRSQGPKGRKVKHPAKGHADAKAKNDIKRTFDSLQTDEGKREFMRQLLLKTKSPSQYYSFIDPILDKAAGHIPKLRAIADGDIEQAVVKYYGKEGSRYQRVTGKFVEEAGFENGIMLPEYIWKDIQRVNSALLNTKQYEAFGNLLKGFDWLNNTFKLGVYTFWPASLTRDIYSNVYLAGLDIGFAALDPKLHADAVLLTSILKGGKNTQRNLARYGEKRFADTPYKLKHLVDMAQDMGVYIPGRKFAEAVGDDPSTLKWFGKTLRGAADKRGLAENEQRLVLWLANIRRGLDPRRAMDRVQEYAFQYSELNQIEREFFRRLIPFWSFTRFNVELQAKMLARNPGKVLNQVKPFRGYNSENEQMISWEAEGLKIRLDRDGKTVHMLNGIDFPLRNLDSLWAGGVGETGRRIMGMVTPLIKTPLEMVTGRDFFTGGDMKRTYGPTLGRAIEHAPKPVQNWLGYKKEFDAAGRPSYSFDGTRYALLVKSWAFSRVFSTSDRQFREYAGDANISGALLDFMTGIREKKIDLDESQRRKLYRRIRQLEQAGVRRGLYREYTRAYTPKEQ